ncbi:hypothetical protein SADUNF_Sadunf04G0154900 [Salix dunnii]|uniref:Uncharacterized protein n=1 Tax=Salix dunnii TaxID=1413687 RepID=A0A835N432_9ROSI|nr:hypothetical protein SADUNF_Sadunf04G0154900 [Salix dunnii]
MVIPEQEVMYTVSVHISGHIGASVGDMYKACERFERLVVGFVKKPNDGPSPKYYLCLVKWLEALFGWVFFSGFDILNLNHLKDLSVYWLGVCGMEEVVNVLWVIVKDVNVVGVGIKGLIVGVFDIKKLCGLHDYTDHPLPSKHASLASSIPHYSCRYMFIVAYTLYCAHPTTITSIQFPWLPPFFVLRPGRVPLFVGTISSEICDSSSNIYAKIWSFFPVNSLRVLICEPKMLPPNTCKVPRPHHIPSRMTVWYRKGNAIIGVTILKS